MHVILHELGKIAKNLLFLFAACSLVVASSPCVRRTKRVYLFLVRSKHAAFWPDLVRSKPASKLKNRRASASLQIASAGTQSSSCNDDDGGGHPSLTLS